MGFHRFSDTQFRGTDGEDGPGGQAGGGQRQGRSGHS